MIEIIVKCKEKQNDYSIRHEKNKVGKDNHPKQMDCNLQTALTKYPLVNSHKGNYMRVNIPRGVAWLPGDSWVKIIAARFYSKSWKGGNQEGGNEKNLFDIRNFGEHQKVKDSTAMTLES